MDTTEKKQKLHNEINKLSAAEMDLLYDKFLALLHNQNMYILSSEERKAIDQSMEYRSVKESFTSEQVMEEAEKKYPNLKFK